MGRCLPAFRNDKVPLASADSGGVPALHAGEVPGPCVHTSRAGRLEPALRGRGAGHESRLGWRVRGGPCPAASAWRPTSVCVCLLLVSVVAQVPLGLLASRPSSTWPSWRGDGAGLSLRLPRLQLQAGVAFPSRRGFWISWCLSGFSLLPSLPSGIPSSAKRGVVLWSQWWRGAGKVEIFESMGPGHPPFSGEPGPSRGWVAELRTPSHFACFPCSSIPGECAFHK